MATGPTGPFGRFLFGTPEHSAKGDYLGTKGGLVNSDPFKAARESLQKIEQGFTSLFSTMAAGLDRVRGIMGRFVEASNPAAIMQFDLALRDLHGVIGQILTPAFRNLTTIVRTLADSIASLSAPAKELLAGLTLGGGLAAAFAGIATAAGFLVKTVGRIPLLIAGIVGAFVGVATSTAGFAEVMGAAQEVFGRIGGVFELIAAGTGPSLLRIGAAVVTVFDRIYKAAEPLIAIAGKLVEGVFDVLATTFEIITPVIVKVIDVIGQLTKYLLDLFNEVRAFFGFAPVGIPKAEVRAGASVGAGTRQTGNTDVRAFLAEANRLSFAGPSQQIQLGQKQLEKLGQQQSTLAQIGTKLEEFYNTRLPALINALPAAIGRAIRENVPGGAAAADFVEKNPGVVTGAAHAATGNPLGAIAGGIRAYVTGDVRDRLRNLFR